MKCEICKFESYDESSITKHKKKCNLTMDDVNNILKLYFVDYLSMCDIQKIYNFKKTTIIKRIIGENNVRNQTQMTLNTKNKISKIRKMFLKDNPDKHHWKYNSKFNSKPCEYFKNILKTKNISFVEEFQPLQDRYFSLDIAILNKKIGIEINGNQHYNNDKTLKPYYQNRHDLITNDGWILLEVHYSYVFIEEKINEIILCISNTSNTIDLFDFNLKKPNIICICGEKKHKNSIRCKNCYLKTIKIKESKIVKIKQPTIIDNICKCGNEKSNKSNKCKNCQGFKCRKVKDRPSVDIILKEVEQLGYTATGRKYGVSDNAIRKWIK